MTSKSMLRNFSLFSTLKTTALIAAMAALVGGCAMTPSKPAAHHAVLEQEKQDADLPKVELTPDVFYDILLGEFAGQRGDLETAVSALSRAARNTRDPRLAERATHAALYAKDYEAATITARLWVELRPESLKSRQTLATVLLERNEPLEAQAHLEKVLQLASANKDFDRVILRIAGLLSRQSNRPAAFAVMESLALKYPKNPQVFLALAHLGVRAGDLERAQPAIDKALSLKPDWEEAALYKARILIGRNETEAVQQFYEAFLDEHEGASKLRLNYARFLVDHKQWQLAHKQFKHVVRDAPDDAEAIFAVGLLSVQAERYKEAEKYLQMNLKLQPKNDQARLYLGQVAEKRKNFASAAKWYGQVRDAKHYFEAQTRLGVMMARQGHLAEARKHLHEIETENEKQKMQLILAEEQILREAKAYHEALKVLNVAIAALPEHTDLRYARALVAEKLDMIPLSESDLRTILKKDPKNVHALNALGYTLADRTDRLEEAKKLIEKALKQKPDDAFVLDSLGWVHYRMGDYQKAIELLNTALSVRNDAEISAHLGEVLWVIGEYSEARSVWERALSRSPESESLQGVIKRFTE